jgi:hypothetical protein
VRDGVPVTVAVALSQRPSHLGDQCPPSRRVAPPGPCLHEEVAALAGPVAAQVRRNCVAATRREEQKPSGPRSLVRWAPTVFATVNT